MAYFPNFTQGLLDTRQGQRLNFGGSNILKIKEHWHLYEEELNQKFT